jgi:hypothetical protein
MLLAVFLKLKKTTLQPFFAHIGVLLKISRTEVASAVAGEFEATRMYICFNSLFVTAGDHAHSVYYIIVQCHWLYWVYVVF